MVTEVPLSRGLVALIDDEDAPAVFAVGKWYARPACRTFYAWKNHRVGGHWQSLNLHRFLTGWPLTDHRNGDGLDCRRINLRRATGLQNQANARRRTDNASGYKGVSWNKRAHSWAAYIGAGGRQKHLGYFPTAELAASAYDVAALALHGEYARLNFPVVTA